MSRALLPSAPSLRLDARGLDHLAPLLGLGGDEPAELRRRTGRQRLAAELEQPRAHRRLRDGCVDLLAQPLHDLGRRAFGRADAEPAGCGIARNEINGIVDQVANAVGKWSQFAGQANVLNPTRDYIQKRIDRNINCAGPGL